MLIFLCCDCGAIKGQCQLKKHHYTRVTCFCNDCQNYAQWLNHPATLDSFYGTDIIQVPLFSIKITEGKAYLQPMRLTPTGIIRWYCRCCHTPIANTVSANLPLAGLITDFIQSNIDFGHKKVPTTFYQQCYYAKKGFKHKRSARRFPSRFFLISLGHLYLALRHKMKENDFFDHNGQPGKEIIVAEKNRSPFSN